MGRPKKHDGVVYKREGSKIWWMRYRDKSGKRQLESTGTEDWQEAQSILRQRLQARDENSLSIVRKGQRLSQCMGGSFFGELLQAANASREYSRGKSDRIEKSPACVWEPAADGDRF